MEFDYKIEEFIQLIDYWSSSSSNYSPWMTYFGIFSKAFDVFLSSRVSLCTDLILGIRGGGGWPSDFWGKTGEMRRLSDQELRLGERTTTTNAERTCRQLKSRASSIDWRPLEDYDERRATNHTSKCSVTFWTKLLVSEEIVHALWKAWVICSGLHLQSLQDTKLVSFHCLL